MKRASVVRHFRCGSGGLGALEPGRKGVGGVVWCGGCGFFGLGSWFGVLGLLDMWEKLKGEMPGGGGMVCFKRVGCGWWLLTGP